MKFVTLSDAECHLKPSVATIGFFDGVHCGHRFLIQQVERYAVQFGLASLLVTFRAHPRQVMHSSYQPQLLSTYEEKCALLAGTGADYCLTLDFTPELAALSARRFMADILRDKFSVKALVIGYNHRFGHDRSESFFDYVAYGKEIGMDVILAQAYSVGEVHVSSSMVRACLAEGEVSMAAKCLGRPYALSGQVVEGFHVGRDLGFPTANLQPDNSQKLVPKNGVYAVRVRGVLDGRERTFDGMLNIGYRPTINNGSNRSIEVHVLDFDGNLYGCRLTLEFIRRLRDEKKFRTRGELVNQLRSDEDAVRMILKNHKAMD